MKHDRATTVLRLIGRDEEWSRDRPGNRRLVCFVEGGGKLAVMGTEDERANMKAVAEVGFPCAIACLRTEPKEWQKRVRGYTDVVHARDPLRVLAPDGAPDGLDASDDVEKTEPRP
jgi:hypothetical protein